jgi:hypothetical protein
LTLQRQQHSVHVHSQHRVYLVDTCNLARSWTWVGEREEQQTAARPTDALCSALHAQTFTVVICTLHTVRRGAVWLETGDMRFQ